MEETKQYIIGTASSLHWWEWSCLVECYVNTSLVPSSSSMLDRYVNDEFRAEDRDFSNSKTEHSPLQFIRLFTVRCRNISIVSYIPLTFLGPFGHPKTKLSVGKCTFSVAVSTIGNQIPITIKSLFKISLPP